MKRAREDWDVLVKSYTSLAEGMKELKLHRRRREDFFSSVLATNVGQLRHNNTMTGTTYAVVNGWGMVLYFIVVGLLIFVLPDYDSRIGRDELTGYAIAVLFMRSYVVALMVLLPYFAQGGVALRKLEDLGFALSQFRGDIDNHVYEPETVSFNRLELKSVTHSYYRDREDSDFILGPIDLTLHAGEAIWIVGGNGSGKTTLAKLLTGLYVPASGESGSTTNWLTTTIEINTGRTSPRCSPISISSKTCWDSTTATASSTPSRMIISIVSISIAKCRSKTASSRPSNYHMDNESG